MNTRAAALTIIGVVLALLGVLWLVQGLGFVEIGPILCLADCEPVTGGSLQWTVIGAVATIVGGVLAWVGLGGRDR